MVSVIVGDSRVVVARAATIVSDGRGNLELDRSGRVCCCHGLARRGQRVTLTLTT